MRFKSPLIVLGLLALWGTGIGAARADGLSMEALRNATFVGIEQQPITLTNGAWEGPTDGGFTGPSARLLDISAAGNLDGKGADETVALIVYSGGGTGQFLNVSVFDSAGTNIASIGIGDRNPVRGLSVDGRDIILDIVTQGPDDGACCATMKARVTLVLVGNELRIVSTEDQGRIGLGDIDGNWVLVGMGDAPPLADVPVTAVFDGGTVAGSAGCNTYSAGYSGNGDSPTSLRFSAIATTRMACAGPRMDQERSYLSRLAAVTDFYWEAGRLGLSYVIGNDYGLLYFSRAD